MTRNRKACLLRHIHICLCVVRQRIEEPFILAVKEELGDRFTISVETTYRATIYFIINEMTKELEKCQQQQQQPTPNNMTSQHQSPLLRARCPRQNNANSVANNNNDVVMATTMTSVTNEAGKQRLSLVN